MICDLPGKLLATVTLNVPLYFMADLRRDAGHFFIYLLFSFAAMLVMSGIIRTIAQLSKTIQQALTPTAFLLEAFVIYTGFILPTKNMQGWLRWVNYLDPLAYAYEAIVINEFSHRRFDCAEFVPAGSLYANVTMVERACSTAGALPGQDFVDGDYYINNNFEYHHSHLWR
jgi:ATP-binding cassette, subfamily G (WHITE), member 2, PDR